MKKSSHHSNCFLHKSLGFGAASLCLAATLLATNTKADGVYFDSVATFSGPTIINSASDASITLVLGANDAIGSNSQITLAGGTLYPGGFNQVVVGWTAMTASSVIDFEAGAAIVEFANSSIPTWTGALTIDNYGGAASGYDLLVGSDTTGLTAAQLADIDFTGYAPGATINSSGDVIPIPEPSTAFLGALGGLGVLLNVRRRKA